MTLTFFCILLFMWSTNDRCPKKDEILKGKYFANHRGMKEYIIVNENETYLHVIESINYKKMGIWNYADCNFSLQNFSYVIPAYSGHEVDSMVTFTISFDYKNGLLSAGLEYLDYSHVNLLKEQ